ncbi:hypothetical protein H1164_08255 [Thermoactinomyces daqus]|uniref:Uncharacterized protein n=1 Tax=Thermoactinomyces daqus TaxID=1329516 RepID=A0A7W2AH60_9BACL|nr:hypothetical protein [Thermoactinomyces daqus]MBA4542892.1 hypothetical protein [Thermoactinomyces daqus]
MALIPLPDKITIKKATGVDSWGKPIYGEEIDYNCRIEEGSQQIVDQHGNTIMTTFKIFLEGAVDVQYVDKISFTNELNQTVERSPAKIQLIKFIDGTAVLTVVFAQ